MATRISQDVVNDLSLGARIQSDLRKDVDSLFHAPISRGFMWIGNIVSSNSWRPALDELRRERNMSPKSQLAAVGVVGLPKFYYVYIVLPGNDPHTFFQNIEAANAPKL